MILVVTVYAGSEELVKMTERMLHQLNRQRTTIEDDLHVTAVCNGAVRPIEPHIADFNSFLPQNVGFGNAVNTAIGVEFAMNKKGLTDVLVMNNDLDLEDDRWLSQLLSARTGKHVISPMTDRTATKAALSTGPLDKDPFRTAQVSAFCWLVPRAIIKMFRGRYRYPLFDPDFFAYGEDDLAGAIMRKHVSPKPFIVVPRSWVRHLKGKTGAEMKLKGGMPENLKLLAKKQRMLGVR